MSTVDGLVRSDGFRFRAFNRQNTPALATNGFSFFALLEDRQGCLWAGTLTGGAVRYCNGASTSFMAGLAPEFAKRNCKIIGLSVDPVSSHGKCAADIEET